MKQKSLLLLSLIPILYFNGCTNDSADVKGSVQGDDVTVSDKTCSEDAPTICAGSSLISCVDGHMVETKCKNGCDPDKLECSNTLNLPTVKINLCENKVCPQNQSCNPNTGRCLDPGSCFDESDCQDFELCAENGKCIDLEDVECTDNDDCDTENNEECILYTCQIVEEIECHNDNECGDNRHCDQNHCVDDEEPPIETPVPAECSESDKPYCEDGRVVSCIDEKIKKTSCGLDQVCDDGRCIDKLCDPGERACRNGQVGVCQPDHSWELSYCETGTYCFKGNCIPHGVAPKVQECGTLTISNTTNTCERSGSGSRIVLRGDVLGLTQTWKGGSVVIEGNHISYVGCDPDMSNATVITCPNSVISPGFINAHEHITFSNGTPASWGDERFDHRHQWRKGKDKHTKISSPQTSVNNGNSVVELRSLMAGTTSIFGSGSAPGLARNLDVKSQTVGNIAAVYQTFPLGDSGDGTMHDSGCSYTYDDTVKNFDEGCPYGPHIAEGINQAALNELRCLSGQGTNSRNILKKNVAVIHGVGATVDIIKQMASNQVKLIWSPRTNISLYGDTAMAPLYDRLGVTIGLGTDWLYSGSATMLRELSCVDYLNQNHYNRYFSDYEIWKMPTYNNAVALGVDKYIGQIAKDMLADVVIFKTTAGKQLHRAVLEAESKDVTLVIQDGKFFYGDDNIMAGKGEQLNVCGTAKRFDLATADAKEGLTFAGDGVLEPKGELSMNDAAAYPMFFCGTPENEPTCVPQRLRDEDTKGLNTTKYTGDFTAADDADGDGIPDDQDNCPTMFNPIRPMDTDRQQSDADNDGYGDICDPYPSCAKNDDSCQSVALDDLDSDTIPDDVDNCPTNPNPTQTDSDGDGKGDACDSCPNDPNPGNQACPSTLFIDFSCTTCKSGSGYAATYEQTLGDVNVSAVGNLQKYNNVYGITLTGNPSTTPPTAIHISGLTGIGTITVQYISYNPTGGKGILKVVSGTKTQQFEHTYNASDTTPKETNFTFNDSTLTEFTIAPEIGTGSDGNNRNRIHITSVSWTRP